MAIRSLVKAKLGQTKSFKLAMGLSPFETAPVRYRVPAPRCFSTGTARCEVYPYPENLLLLGDPPLFLGGGGAPPQEHYT